MSTGADNKSLPITAEYADGYDRTFGKPSGERGTFIYDKRLKRCVPIEEYQPEETEQAIHAPIMVDRFYEGASTAVVDEKTGQVSLRDIGSRRKHRQYMKENNLTTVDDFKDTWAQAAKEREKVRAGDVDHKERRELIGKIQYEVEKNARRR